jgi:hypothetical protein
MSMIFSLFYMTQHIFNIIFIILYLYILFLFIFICFYYFLFNSQPNAIFKACITNNALFSVVRVFILLVLLLCKVIYMYGSFILFNHFFIGGLLYHNIVFNCLILFIILYYLLNIQNSRPSDTPCYILLVLMLSLFITLLWGSRTFFAVLLSLDCTNLLILCLLLLSARSTSLVELGDTSYQSLIGISVFFWVSFLTTILILLCCVFFINSVMTLNIDLTVFFMPFLSVIGAFDQLQLSIAIFLFFISLLIKGGSLLFFIWKRLVFASMNFIVLGVYMFYYFFFIFIYMIYMLILFISYAYPTILFLLILLIGITVLLLVSFIESGLSISNFFVLSTLFNVTYIFFSILALAILL